MPARDHLGEAQGGGGGVARWEGGAGKGRGHHWLCSCPGRGKGKSSMGCFYIGGEGVRETGGRTHPLMEEEEEGGAEWAAAEQMVGWRRSRAGGLLVHRLCAPFPAAGAMFASA